MITAGVPVAGIGVTLRGIITANPLSLGAKYPADGTAVGAWAVLVAGGVAGVLLGRRWWAGRHRDSPLGFASAQAAQMSAGERRARDKARWSRRGSVARGFDPDTAPLHEVGFLLGHERGAGEPVVLTLEDQTGIIAPTGAGKTLHLIVGACLDAPGPLVATSTRPEILDAIVEARTTLGRVWVFDPLNAAYWPEPMVWDPTAGAQDPNVASARGLAFAGGLQVDERQGRGVLPGPGRHHHGPPAAGRGHRRPGHGRRDRLGDGPEGGREPGRADPQTGPGHRELGHHPAHRHHRRRRNGVQRSDDDGAEDRAVPEPRGDAATDPSALGWRCSTRRSSCGPRTP